MELMRIVVKCSTCNKDLTDMGPNYINHLTINNHKGIREEYMMFKK